MGSAGHRCPVAARIQRKRLLRKVGRRIAKLRKERDVTQEELAARLRVDDRYVRRIEAGEVNVSLWYLARIANVLRVQMVAFFDSQAT